MLNMTKTFLAMMFSSFTLYACEPQIVKLTPPQISNETISQKIASTRPMREGKFNISLEESSDKMIINWYGHGGSGWTTLFGSVNKAIELFQKTNPDKTIPIRIIGSGCMGLTSAIELSKLGYRIAGISTKDLLRYTLMEGRWVFCAIVG